VCPIPEFDKENPIHREIVALSKSAKKIVEKWGPSIEGGLAAARERTRALISEEIRKIDSLVDSLFGTTKPATVSGSKSPRQASIF
jgi:hypothetical protein